MENNKSLALSFGLRKIKTEQFAVIESLFKDNSKVGISTEVNFKVDFDKRLLGIFSKFQFDSDKNPFIILEVSCHFQVEKKAWESFFDEKIRAYTIPRGFISHLAMLSIGTARGTLHAKTENTRFNDFIIPTINVAELIKEDVIFNVE